MTGSIYFMKYSCFFGKWSRTPEEFANASAFYLGGPVKLVVIPSAVIAVIEVFSLTNRTINDCSDQVSQTT